MTTSTTTSASSEAAIRHLKRIKPLDGWSVVELKSSGSGVRLHRRGRPITDNAFIDIHHDIASGNVVGIVSSIKTAGKYQAQILVDSNGIVVNGIKVISVAFWKPGGISTSSSSSTSRGTTTTSSSAGTSGSGSENGTVGLSHEENMELMKYVGYGVGGMIVLRVLLQSFVAVYILGLPVLYFYMTMNCPAISSFDAKKELKRVLRGHHLPDDHPNKPRGFFGETIARINASVATELATGLGYEIRQINMGTAAIISSVYVPTVERTYHWLGAFNKWWFLFSQETAKSD